MYTSKSSSKSNGLVFELFKDIFEDIWVLFFYYKDMFIRDFYKRKNQNFLRIYFHLSTNILIT